VGAGVVEDVPLGLPLPVIDAPDPMVDRPAMIIEDSAAKVTPKARHRFSAPLMALCWSAPWHAARTQAYVVSTKARLLHRQVSSVCAHPPRFVGSFRQLSAQAGKPGS